MGTTPQSPAECGATGRITRTALVSALLAFSLLLGATPPANAATTVTAPSVASLSTTLATVSTADGVSVVSGSWPGGTACVSGSETCAQSPLRQIATSVLSLSGSLTWTDSSVPNDDAAPSEPSGFYWITEPYMKTFPSGKRALIYRLAYPSHVTVCDRATDYPTGMGDPTTGVSTAAYLEMRPVFRSSSGVAQDLAATMPSSTSSWSPRNVDLGDGKIVNRCSHNYNVTLTDGNITAAHTNHTTFLGVAGRRYVTRSPQVFEYVISSGDVSEVGYPNVGSPASSSGPSDPDRRTKTLTHCVAASDLGSYNASNPSASASYSTTQRLSSTYNESDGSERPAAVVAPCASGHPVKATVRVQTLDNGSWVDAESPVITIDANPNSWDPGTVGSTCVPGGSSYPCSLELQKLVSTSTSNKWSSCHNSSTDCSSWDVSTPTQNLNNPEYRCRFGNTTVSKQECLDSYLPSTETPSFPTGTAEPEQEEQIADGCVPDGLDALNPFELVKSVGCLFEAAFVPTENTSEQLALLRDAIRDQPPGSWLIDIAGGFQELFNAFTDNGVVGVDACHTNPSGLPVMPGVDESWDNVYCGASSRMADDFANMRQVISACLWLATAFAVYRIAERAFDQ